MSINQNGLDLDLLRRVAGIYLKTTLKETQTALHQTLLLLEENGQTIDKLTLTNKKLQQELAEIKLVTRQQQEKINLQNREISLIIDLTEEIHTHPNPDDLEWDRHDRIGCASEVITDMTDDLPPDYVYLDNTIKYELAPPRNN